MALNAGDVNASSGMSKEIYSEMRTNIVDPMFAGIALTEAQLAIIRPKMEENLKKMAYSISRGVIRHLLSNMEIRNVKVEHSFSHENWMNTGAIIPLDGGAALKTSLTISAQSNIEANTSVQSNSGPGLVK